MTYKVLLAQLQKITEDDFITAKNYFESNPAEPKWRKSATGSIGHSFLKDASGNIYAMSKDGYLGRGGLGKVKLVKRSDGKILKVKITPGHHSPNLKNETTMSNKINDEKVNAPLIFRTFSTRRSLHSQKYPDLAAESRFKSTAKHYGFMPAFEGENLFQLLTELNTIQRQYVALQCCEQVKSLHHKNILHRDIKSSNFIVHVDSSNPLNIQVKLNDFDQAREFMTPEETYSTYNRAGTNAYLAPELNLQPPFIYSKTTDYFALGKVLCDLKYNVHSLVSTDPAQRNLDATIEILKRSIIRYCFNLLANLKTKEVWISQTMGKLSQYQSTLDLPLAYAFISCLMDTTEDPSIKFACQRVSFLLLKVKPAIQEQSVALLSQYQQDPHKMATAIKKAATIQAAKNYAKKRLKI